MSITIKKEKRLSRKIIVHRLNRHLPFLKPLIVKWRFLTFRNKCKNYPNPTSYYSDGSWLERKVTKGQKTITDYIGTKDISGKRFLHIGIGNSEIAKLWPENFTDGITVVSSEKDFAKTLNLPNYQVFLMDKNDQKALKTLAGDYDFIIDCNLASYSCCKRHFEEMFSTFSSLLKKDGEIISDKAGLYYFDSGFPPNLLYLKTLAQKNNLQFLETDQLIIFKK